MVVIYTMRRVWVYFTKRVSNIVPDLCIRFSKSTTGRSTVTGHPDNVRVNVMYSYSNIVFMAPKYRRFCFTCFVFAVIITKSSNISFKF